MKNNKQDGFFFFIYYMKNSEQGEKLLENHAHLFRDQRVSENISEEIRDLTAYYITVKLT